MKRSKNITTEIQGQAWVVFSGQADLPWLKILKPGFRHCAVLINDGKHWLTLDPLSSYTDIMVHNVETEFDLPLWLQDRGHTVVPATLKRWKTAAPWGLMTCVESVKRVLGIRNCLIFTPWQLYKYLTKNSVYCHSNSSQCHSGEGRNLTAAEKKIPAYTGMTSKEEITTQGDLSWEV